MADNEIKLKKFKDNPFFEFIIKKTSSLSSAKNKLPSYVKESIEKHAGKLPPKAELNLRINQYLETFQTYFDSKYVDLDANSITLHDLAKDKELVEEFNTMMTKEPSKNSVNHFFVEWLSKPDLKGRKPPQEWIQIAASHLTKEGMAILLQAKQNEQSQKEKAAKYQKAQTKQQAEINKQKEEATKEATKNKIEFDEYLKEAEIRGKKILEITAKKEEQADEKFKKEAENNFKEKVEEITNIIEKTKIKFNSREAVLKEVYDKEKGKNKKILIYIFETEEDYILYSGKGVDFNPNDSHIVDIQDMKVDPSKNEIIFNIDSEKARRFISYKKLVIANAFAENLSKTKNTNELVWSPSGKVGKIGALPQPDMRITIEKINGKDVKKNHVELIEPINELDIHATTTIHTGLIGKSGEPNKILRLYLEVQNPPGSNRQPYIFYQDQHPQLFPLSDGKIDFKLAPTQWLKDYVGASTILKLGVYEHEKQSQRIEDYAEIKIDDGVIEEPEPDLTEIERLIQEIIDMLKELLRKSPQNSALIDAIKQIALQSTEVAKGIKELLKAIKEGQSTIDQIKKLNKVAVELNTAINNFYTKSKKIIPDHSINEIKNALKSLAKAYTAMIQGIKGNERDIKLIVEVVEKFEIFIKIIFKLVKNMKQEITPAGKKDVKIRLEIHDKDKWQTVKGEKRKQMKATVEIYGRDAQALCNNPSAVFAFGLPHAKHMISYEQKLYGRGLKFNCILQTKIKVGKRSITEGKQEVGPDEMDITKEIKKGTTVIDFLEITGRQEVNLVISERVPPEKGVLYQYQSNSISVNFDDKESNDVFRRLNDYLDKTNKKITDDINITFEDFKAQYDSDKRFMEFLNKLDSELKKDIKSGTKWTHDSILKHVKQQLEDYMRSYGLKIKKYDLDIEKEQKRMKFYAKGSMEKMRSAIMTHGKEIIKELNLQDEVDKTLKNKAAIESQLKALGKSLQDFQKTADNVIKLTKERQENLRNTNNYIEDWIKHMVLDGTPEQKVNLEKESELAITTLRKRASDDVELMMKIKDLKKELNTHVEEVNKNPAIKHIVTILGKIGLTFNDYDGTQKDWGNKIIDIFKKR